MDVDDWDEMDSENDGEDGGEEAAADTADKTAEVLSGPRHAGRR